MPDMTLEIFFNCETAEGFNTEVQGSKTYIVAFGPSKEGYDWTCSCDAFKYGKGKYCKHIKQVEQTRCGWMQYVHGGEPVENNHEYFCPKCGAKAHPRKWAV